MYYVHFLSSCFTITSKTDKVFFIKYFKGILDFGCYSPFTSRSFFVNLYRITRIIEQTYK